MKCLECIETFIASHPEEFERQILYKFNKFDTTNLSILMQLKILLNTFCRLVNTYINIYLMNSQDVHLFAHDVFSLRN